MHYCFVDVYVSNSGQVLLLTLPRFDYGCGKTTEDVAVQLFLLPEVHICLAWLV